MKQLDENGQAIVEKVQETLEAEGFRVIGDLERSCQNAYDYSTKAHLAMTTDDFFDVAFQINGKMYNMGFYIRGEQPEELHTALSFKTDLGVAMHSGHSPADKDGATVEGFAIFAEDVKLETAADQIVDTVQKVYASAQKYGIGRWGLIPRPGAE